MKVAIIGAPGSGKTKVANAIARRLDDWKVVDGYVDRLAKRTDLTYGFEADWPMNVQVMGARWEAETAAVKNGSNALCCGSLYETAVYATGWSLNQMARYQRSTTFREEQRFMEVMTNFISAMEVATIDYDLIIRLETPEPRDHTWEGVVDAKLPEVIDAYFRKAYTLPGATTREKADAATEAIREVQRALSPPASEPE